MKPFVIGRKNRFFSNTRKDGDVSCAVYSPAKTAIYNGLDAWAYRKWLFSELPHKKHEGFAYSDCLPWSGKVPDWVKERKRSGKEQREAASDTDIIRLRHRFGYTSLFLRLLLNGT